MSHDMTKPTKWLCAQRRQISLGIRPVWSASSMCAQWVAKDPRFLHADSEDSDKTGRMPRLIWVFAGCTVTLLVLSCHGSLIFLWLDSHILSVVGMVGSSKRYCIPRYPFNYPQRSRNSLMAFHCWITRLYDWCIWWWAHIWQVWGSNLYHTKLQRVFLCKFLFESSLHF